MNYKQVCNTCGSEEVARCKWVNVNTNEVYSAYSGTELEWCFGDCKSETKIIDVEVKMTSEEVRNLIADNEFFVIKVLKLLYNEQTDEEQEESTTTEQNGRGFNANDADFCSSLAEQTISGKDLSYKQIAALRKILPKYSKQISKLL
jgi:hypothetical protein